jgi:sRNA-binding carbon storage regulator CsrA
MKAERLRGDVSHLFCDVVRDVVGQLIKAAHLNQKILVRAEIQVAVIVEYNTDFVRFADQAPKEAPCALSELKSALVRTILEVVVSLSVNEDKNH